MGPSIGPCCYEVGPEVREAFLSSRGADTASPWFTARGNGTDRWILNLWQANRDQLTAAGVPAAQVHVAGLCTVHHPDRLCSYRRDGQTVGRMAGAIRMRTP
jgi:hypothetical protein